MQRGFANFVLIAFGFLLIALIAGFFVSRQAYSPVLFPSVTGEPTSPFSMYTANSCGLVVSTPKENALVGSSVHIAGFVNGCGWKVKDHSAGTVELVNESGQVISGTYVLQIPEQNLFGASYFDLTLVVRGPKTATGTLFFKSVDGEKQFFLPIRFTHS